MSDFTVADAAAFLLDQECGACGSLLPGPGEPCGVCGAIPGVTSAELAADLASPQALAAVEAEKLLREARALLDQAIARHAERSRVLRMGKLKEDLALAQAGLDTATRDLEDKRAELAGPLRKARKARHAAEADLTRATAEYQELAAAAHLAEKMKHGLKAETRARRDRDEAAAVLANYEGYLAAAIAEAGRLEGEIAPLAATVKQREEDRDKALAAVASPGRIPVSEEAVTDLPVRLWFLGHLDEAEILMLAYPAEILAKASGLVQEIEARARRQLKDEQEREKRDKPLHLQPLGNGDIGVAPNPLHPGNPQPYDPPGPGAVPQQGHIPLIGGFG